MEKFRIVIGSDHAGFKDKTKLVAFLRSLGHRVKDVGTYSVESTDYPDYAARVARGVSAKRFDRGVLICGTGNGMAIAANKVKGVRAAVCWNTKIGKLASEHNWANVLCLPARFINFDRCKRITKVWLLTSPDKDARHERRIKKITQIESHC